MKVTSLKTTINAKVMCLILTITPTFFFKMGKKKKYNKGKHQTGSTTLGIDRKISAKPIGKRISETGNIYYEYRKNRSDLNKKLRL